MSAEIRTEREKAIHRAVCKIKFRDWTLHQAWEVIYWEYPCVDPITGEALLLQGRAYPMWDVPDERLERETITTAFLAVKTILEHEAREEFFYGTTRPFDPHNRPFAGEQK